MLVVVYGKKLTPHEQDDDAGLNKFDLARYYRIGISYAERLIRDLPTLSICGVANPAHPKYQNRGPVAVVETAPQIEIEDVERWLADRGVETKDILLVGDGVALVFGTIKAANSFIGSLDLEFDDDPDALVQKLLAQARVSSRLVGVSKTDRGRVTSGRWRHTVVLPGNLVTSLGLVTSSA
jgi:hypothetical protein